MKIGKRRQPTRGHHTSVGTVIPAMGLSDRHAGRSLRLGVPAGADTPPGEPGPVLPRSDAHLRRAAKILIGCARRAGMGSIRVVNEATRLLLRRATRPGADVEHPVRALVEASADASDHLTIDANEARRAAQVAALIEEEPDALTWREDEPAQSFSALPASLQPTGVQRPVSKMRALAAVAVREVIDDIASSGAAGSTERAARSAVRAAKDTGAAPFAAIRQTARALVCSGLHAGADVGQTARGVVRGVVSAAPRLGLSRRAAGAIAAHHVVDAAADVGRHAAAGAFAALTTWDPRAPRRAALTARS